MVSEEARQPRSAKENRIARPRRPGASTTDPVPKRTKSGKSDVLAQYGDRLANLLETSDRVVGSGVQLVGLDRIKDQLGDAWPRRSTQILEIATRIINQYLAPQDLLVRLSDTQFLIMFANIDPERAKLKCGLIAKMLSDRLEGEGDLSSIEVRTVVKEIDGSIGLQSDRLDSLIADMLPETMDEASTHEPRVEASAAGDTDPADAFAGIPTLTVDRIAFEYREILDVKRQVVVSFRVVPYWVGAFGKRYEDYRLLDALSGPPEDFIPALDQRQIEHTLQAMVRYFKGGRSAIFITSVHFHSLSHLASRMALMTFLSQVPRDLKSFLVLNIDALPEGVPSSRVTEFVAALKAHCRHVTIAVDVEAPAIGLATNTGALGVTMDVGRHLGREIQLIRKINKFAAQADKLGLKIGFRGIRSSSMLLNCVAAGCHWIEGPTIGEPTASPPPASRFSWTDWYKAKMER